MAEAPRCSTKRRSSLFTENPRTTYITKLKEEMWEYLEFLEKNKNDSSDVSNTSADAPKMKVLAVSSETQAFLNTLPSVEAYVTAATEFLNKHEAMQQERLKLQTELKHTISDLI